MNPYVFLVGCPRSGTTLLGRLADAHPDLAVIHETRWIIDMLERRLGITADGLVSDEITAHMSDPVRLKPYGFTPAELGSFPTHDAAARPLPYATYVTGLFDLFGRRRSKRLVGDKTPGYVRYIPALDRLWPSARFVHIIRDGRDVALSVLDWGKGATSFSSFADDPVSTIAVWWEWYVRLGLESGPALGADRYHEIRYESLTADAPTECERLCRFLGLPYDEAMLRFHEGRTDRRPGLSSKSQWLPVTSGLRSWRTQMDADESLRFEAAAGSLLEELGYPLSRPGIPAPARANADAIRQRFIRQVEKRRKPLPRAWSVLVA